MKQTYQHGYLRRSKRKTSADQWEFLWRERDESGVMRRRTAILGTIEKYLDESAAQAAANGLRMRINADILRQRQTPILISDLIDHCIATHLSAEAGSRSIYRGTVGRCKTEASRRPFLSLTEWQRIYGYGRICLPACLDAWDSGRRKLSLGGLEPPLAITIARFPTGRAGHRDT